MKDSDNDIRNELFSKIEQSKSSLLMNNNYKIFKDIIEKSKCIHLKYVNKRLLNTVDHLSESYKYLKDEDTIDYIRFSFNSKLVNLGLNILHSIMIEDPIGFDQTFMHRHAGMGYLLRSGYNPEHIIDQMDLKEGKTDFFTSNDVQGHEIKFLEGGIRMCFTLPQFVNFDENDDIIMFKRIRDNLYKEIINIGYIYIGKVKFGDILNKKYPYKIEVRSSDLDDAIKERIRVLADRRKQRTIFDW